jgi:hypothetical protein
MKRRREGEMKKKRKVSVDDTGCRRKLKGRIGLKLQIIR